MQQTLNQTGWYQRSRLKGALRFHFLKVGKIIAWVLAILLAAQLLGVIIAACGLGDYSSGGVAAEFGTEMVALLLLACMLANSSTTFLLRFGTPRTSVWLSNLIALVISGLAFLLGTLVLSILFNYLVLAMSTFNSAFSVSQYSGSLSGTELITVTLSKAVSQLPMMALWTVEWSCLFYLLGCCLKRSKAITLTVCIVLPLLLWLLMLLPAVRQVIEIAESGNQTGMMVMGIQWLGWLQNAANFFINNWQWIQGVAALVSLPLSWLCMRSTPQP
ncbi:MAG: hypothetical protein PHI98_08890 [Eubacteriales bacterium]|nr:hypothetical protein [Eubacteriales bacterium]